MPKAIFYPLNGDHTLKGVTFPDTSAENWFLSTGANASTRSALKPITPLQGNPTPAFLQFRLVLFGQETIAKHVGGSQN